MKAPAKGESTCCTWETVKDIKPIIIEDDDDQDIKNLNKDNVAINKDVTSHIRLPKAPDQVYSQPITRLPPRPPDLLGSNPQGHSMD